MTKDNNDNQLSTVLLLIALSLLIYFLTKPKSNTVCESENTYQMEPYTNTYPGVLDQLVASNPVATNPVASKQVASKQVASIPVATNPVASKQVASNPVATNPVATKPVATKQVTINPVDTYETDKVIVEPTDVFHFEPTDVQEFGASLDYAFDRPIPQTKQTDSVDINKNNVSNYNAKDFLPNEINNEWFDTDFSQAKININDDKLINTDRYVIGVNTVGQSLKNASYDIRGTIPNPKMTVSPWNNSTYEPDFNIKPLC